MEYELVSVENTENSTYKQWLEFYNKHSFDENGDCITREYEDIINHLQYTTYYNLEDYHYHYKYNYGIKNETSVDLLFSFNREDYYSKDIANIEDFLINPNTDLVDAIRGLLITFQKIGYIAIKLDCRFMYHNNSFIRILKKMNGTELDLSS